MCIRSLIAVDSYKSDRLSGASVTAVRIAYKALILHTKMKNQSYKDSSGSKHSLGKFDQAAIATLAQDLAALLDAHYNKQTLPANDFLEHPDVQALLQCKSLSDAISQMVKEGLPQQLWSEVDGTADAATDPQQSQSQDETKGDNQASMDTDNSDSADDAEAEEAAAFLMDMGKAVASNVKKAQGGKGAKDNKKGSGGAYKSVSSYWIEWPAGSGDFALALSKQNFPPRIVLPTRVPGKKDGHEPVLL